MEFSGADVARGDCFAVGVPRTADQAYAVRNLGIDADEVRELSTSITTIAGWAKYKETGETGENNEEQEETGENNEEQEETGENNEEQEETGEVIDGPAIEVIKEYLVANGVKPMHIPKDYEKALNKAISLGFILND